MIIKDVKRPEASQASDGYILATVSYSDVEGGRDEGVEEMLEELLQDLREWQARSQRRKPQKARQNHEER